MLVVLILCFFAMLYIGAALGFLMMTYNVKSLKLARKIWWYVPYITIRLTLLVLSDLFTERDMKKFISFMFSGCKMTMVGMILAKCAVEIAEKKNVSQTKAIKCFKYLKYTKKKETVYKEYSRCAKMSLA